MYWSYDCRISWSDFDFRRFGQDRLYNYLSLTKTDGCNQRDLGWLAFNLMMLKKSWLNGLCCLQHISIGFNVASISTNMSAGVQPSEHEAKGSCPCDLDLYLTSRWSSQCRYINLFVSAVETEKRLVLENILLVPFISHIYIIIYQSREDIFHQSAYKWKMEKKTRSKTCHKALFTNEKKN